MPFELPSNLHANCGPLAWMLGTWHGNGHGDYPTIEPFSYGQEVVVQQDGRPFFHYFARSWIIDENGGFVRDAAQETGFLRCPEPGKVEMLLVHTSGVSETWYGQAEDGKVELHTAGVSFTESAKEVTGGHRLYGNVEGDLLYAYDMAAVGQELQPHLWARLQRS
ncbi:FABP family protein [Nocardioides acrostichi]|uniref:Peroxynitrite isomerase n=1 Tax=Nocardioides acrostichi TaxID=2784339 RepID=A0A930V297_9ACTN|nr:FABP family protein [Nocardioides acrostichi]MBF4162556.1 FABP family protein [Nocardioides acrostichi]